MGAVILFLFSFAMAVFAVYTYMRSDDTAFNKAKADLELFNAEIRKHINQIHENADRAVTAQDELRKLIEGGFEAVRSDQMKTVNRMDALDLELTRVKEKINKINIRATPTTHTVKLEIVEPKAVVEGTKKAPEIPKDLLERAGIKKSKPRNH